MAVIYKSTVPIMAPTIVVVLAISALFIKFFVQYWNLKHIPGPWQAKISNFWLARKFWNHESFADIALDLDKKYGPVVAYGPNRVLFSDPSAVGVIFNTKDALRKAESYDTAVPLVNGKPVVSLSVERDEARISAIKKQIIGAFTTKAMLDYEHHVDHNIDYLMNRLATSEEREFNIAKWHIFFAFDTICNIAFSENQGLMEKQADLGNTLAGARQRFLHWHEWQSLPWLEKLLHKNMWAVKRSIGNSTGSILGQMAMDRLEGRLKKGGAGTENDLLDRFLQAWERDPATFNKGTVAGLILSMIHAGAETTSATLNVTLYHLLHSPQSLATLKAELDAANLSSPPTWTEVSKLRYLEACFKEAGRLHPLLLDPMEREVPNPGLTIAGTFVPGGNIVAINTHALNHDPDVWGEAVDEYQPGRWIDCDETQLQKMERANLLFSGGRRLCIGQHVAWIEMKKFLPELLMRFDIELIHPGAPLKTAGCMTNFIDELIVRLTPR